MCLPQECSCAIDYANLEQSPQYMFLCFSADSAIFLQGGCSVFTDLSGQRTQEGCSCPEHFNTPASFSPDFLAARHAVPGRVADCRKSSPSFWKTHENLVEFSVVWYGA